MLHGGEGRGEGSRHALSYTGKKVKNIAGKWLSTLKQTRVASDMQTVCMGTLKRPVP